MQCEDSTSSNACKGFVVPSVGLTYEIQAIIAANGLEGPTKAHKTAHRQYVAHGHQKSEK